MSKFQQPRTRSFVAAVDLSAKKYHGVKLHTTEGQVTIAGAGEAEFVLMNAPLAGEIAECAMIGGGAQVHSGAAFALGAELASDANGKFITALSTNKVVAIALSAAAGADEYVEVERVRYVKA
jgi:hypothetical protein